MNLKKVAIDTAITLFKVISDETAQEQSKTVSDALYGLDLDREVIALMGLAVMLDGAERADILDKIVLLIESELTESAEDAVAQMVSSITQTAS